MPSSPVKHEPTEITALYGCLNHYIERMTRETEKIRISVPSTYCGAEQGRSCTRRPESCNQVHAAQKKKTDRQVERLRSSRLKPPARGQVWELASSPGQT